MILLLILTLMNSLTRYPPNRRLICSHHLILHAKVASTSLRQCGEPVALEAAWDQPTVAIIREPLQRWVSGYIMYLFDLARWSDGKPRFRPPYHFTYDVHTTQQVYKIRKDTHLIRFEDIQEYADRAGFILPHLHKQPRNHIKSEIVQWMKDNEDFKQALKQHLRLDYQLREKCQSVQSLPENLFTK